MPSKKKITETIASENNGTPNDLSRPTPIERIPATESQKYEELNFIDTSKPVWNYSLLTDEDVSIKLSGWYQLPVVQKIRFAFHTGK